MRSPPARALTDYFFKVRQPLAIQSNARLRGRESCALLQERERHHLRYARLRRAPRQSALQPRRGFHALREGFSPHERRHADD
jgi:hypothetical protein